MTQEEFEKLLAKFVEGECNPEEEDRVLRWYEKIPSEADQISENDRKMLEARLWAKLKPTTAKGSVYKKKSAVLHMVLRLAAVFLPGICAGIFIYLHFFKASQLSSPSVTYRHAGLLRVENTKAIASTIRLEDGSEVTLQPHGILEYPDHFNDNKREVYLTGEAFFQVVRDPQHPFFVHAQEIVTKVLGTSFTVKAYNDGREVSVVVKTGKVSVYKQEQESAGNAPSNVVVLTPNQEAVYSREREQVVRKLADVPQIINPHPIDLKMSYDETPVAQVFSALQANYGIPITFDRETLASCTVTTSLLEEGLYERVEIVCKAINATYTVTDSSIVVRGKGCE